MPLAYKSFDSYLDLNLGGAMSNGSRASPEQNLHFKFRTFPQKPCFRFLGQVFPSCMRWDATRAELRVPTLRADRPAYPAVGTLRSGNCE